MPQVVGQREWDPGTRCAKDRSCSGQANRRICQDPADKIVLPLTQPGALSFEKQVPGSPGEHQKCDDPCLQQREPATLHELGRVGSDKYQVDDEKEPVDGRYDQGAETPM